MSSRPMWATEQDPDLKKPKKQKHKVRLDKVAHACNPSYSGGGDRED
jgi:hypothetical protein